MADGKNTAAVGYIARKLSEPSTWAGLAIITQALGVPGGLFMQIAQGGMVFMGALAMFLNEKSAGN